MSNQRRNIAIQIQTPGGDNPLLVSLVAAGPYYRGVAVSGLALVGKGGTAPYAYSIIATSSNDLPPGLSVNPLSGQITGTPSLAGHFSFIAQVSDSASATFTHSFSITILAQLFWRGPPPPKGEINVSYNYQFRVFDAAGTLLTSGFTYDGTLPAGLTLSTGGLLSGTPTAPAGISYATVHATDGTDTLDIPIAIEIAEAVNGYYLEDRDPPDGWGGGSGSWLPSIVRLVDWSAHLVITGGVGPYSVVDSETDPPPTGITINNSRSRILGGRTADAASTDAKLISVIITDALGATKAIQRATLIIDSQQPRITPRKNGSELSGGNGFTNFDLVEGDGVSIEATNDGATVQYRVSASGGAGGGIATIAGVGPDSSGNLEIEGIEQDSSGGLRVTAESGVTYTEAGLVASFGAIGGDEILVGALASETRSMSPAEYDYSVGTSSIWQLWVSPVPTTGTFTLDVRKRVFGNTLPDTDDSICASALPSLSGNSTDFTASGSTSTWTDAPIARGDMVSVVPTVNTAGVTWFALFIPARRSF